MSYYLKLKTDMIEVPVIIKADTQGSVEAIEAVENLER